MLDVLLLFCALLLAGTLVTSGGLKAADPGGSERTVRAVAFVPDSLVRPAAVALPAVEVVLALGLVLTRGVALVAVALASVALMVLFTAVVLRLLRRGDPVSCHCFGSASDEPVSGATLVRNGVLGLLGLVVVGAAPSAGGVGPVLASADWRESVLTVLAVVLVGGGAALWARIRTLTRELDVLLDAASTVGEPAATVPIPQATVVDSHGAVRTLAALSAERAQLVIAVSPSCSACHDVAPMIPQWRHGLGDEVDVVLLCRGGRDAALAAYPQTEGYLYTDPDGAAFAALGVAGTPSAVLLGTNQTVAAGPAPGADKIIELITAVVQAIGVNVMTGQAHQAQGPRPTGGEDHGEAFLPAPGTTAEDVRVRSEDGHELSLSEALRSHTPADGDVTVVAWRNGCSYCGEIVDQMRFFSATGDVVLLVNEDVSTVRAQGIEGPAYQVLDDDNARVLALPGTPAGYPVRDLCVVSGGGVGGGSVLRMLRDRAVRTGALTEEQAASAVFGARAPQPHDHHTHDHHHEHV